MLKKLILSSCSFIMVSSFAMSKQDSYQDHMKVMLILSAELASGLTPEEIEKKMLIDASEISKVTQQVNGRVESYTVQLSDGDILKAQHYLEGPLKGEFDCARLIKNKHCYPNMAELPVNKHYFHVLKEKYEESQLCQSKAGHYNDDRIFILPVD